MEKSTITLLYDAYEKTLTTIRANRKNIKDNQNKNQELQSQLKQIRDSLSGLIQIEIRQQGSLYKVCKKEFGKIDKRFYRICSMLGKKL